MIFGLLKLSSLIILVKTNINKLCFSSLRFNCLFASIIHEISAMLRNTVSLIKLSSVNQLQQNVRTLFISATSEAARKGTREKARQKKVKVEIKKIGFIPHNQRKK